MIHLMNIRTLTVVDAHAGYSIIVMNRIITHCIMGTFFIITHNVHII